MEFRDLKRQYTENKEDIDRAIAKILSEGVFIGGDPVARIEKRLADYVDVKHCISCANGTDALELALIAWGIGYGDAVFVPDFTFFASGEVVSRVGASPIFVDIDKDTYNISATSLEEAIDYVRNHTNLKPKVIISVDLFGQPAEYEAIQNIAKKEGLLILEDSAQGFGGSIGDKKACSFGDISTTSFFPAKPLGCYGDGGAIFTNNDEWAALIKSIKVHGKGNDKYDNVRIGVNSRLDTIQAAILDVKLTAFVEHELEDVNRIADKYTEKLSGMVKTPTILKEYTSSWAQYAIELDNEKERDRIKEGLSSKGIPTMVYYPKAMHNQEAFAPYEINLSYDNTNSVCKRILELPMHPYLLDEDVEFVSYAIREIL